MFETLQNRIDRTPLTQYGQATQTSFPRVIFYDGSPLNYFFLKHGVESDRIHQVLDESAIGNALEIPRGTPLVIRQN